MKIISHCICMFIITFCFKTVAVGQNYWKHYEMPYNATIISQADSNHIVAAGDGRGIYKTDDGGKNWTNVYLKTNPGINGLYIRDIAFQNQNLIIAVADSIRNINPPGQSNNFVSAACILRSADGAKSWTIQNFGYTGGNNSRLFSRIIMNDQKDGVIAQHQLDTNTDNKLSPLLYTRDGGLTWNSPKFPDTSFAITILGYLPVEHSVSSPKAGTWFVHGRDYKLQKNVLWHTLDYGKTWVLGTSPIENTTKIHFIDSLTGFAIGYKTSQRIPVFAKTNNGGKSWEIQQFDSKKISIAFIDIDFENKLNGLIAADNIIVRTTDGGITWQEEFTGLSDSTGKRGTSVARISCSENGGSIGATRDGIMIKYVAEGITAQPQITTPQVISSAGLPAPIFPIPGEVKWNAVPGAYKYYIDIKVGEFSYVEVLSTIFDSTNTNSYTIKALPPANAPGHLKNTYNVRVRAISLTSASNWSVAVPFRFESTVSVNENSLIDINKPYPNPANDIIYIPFKRINESEISITISDALGKQLNSFKSTYSPAQNAVVLSALKDAAEGIYFVQISQGNHSQTSMITISK